MLGPLSYGVYSQVTAVNWYEAGGVSGLVAAYQAKDAASKAASLLDLSVNGYNLAETGTVTWSALTGWSGWSGANYLQYIATRFLAGAVARTVAVRMTPTNYSSGIRNIVGLSDSLVTSGKGWSLTPELAVRYNGGNNVYAGDGANADQVYVVTYNGGATSGVLAYKNGTLLSETGSSSTTPDTEGGITIGGGVNGAAADAFGGNIALVACYDNRLSGSEVAALSTAMAAV